MNRHLPTLAAVCLITLTAGQPAPAQRPDLQDDARDARRVFPPSRPDDNSRRPDADPSEPGRRGGHRDGLDAPQVVVRYVLPSPYPYVSGYPTYYDGARSYLGPLYIRSEELYGPQALARFLGWDTANRQPPVVVVRPEADSPRPIDEAKEDPEQRAKLRGTNQQALALAWKFIGYSDAHFADGDYSVAYQGYRKAAEAAPLLADSYFRQGYALMALGRYEQAAAALRKGLARNPDWPSSGFSNQELYGGDQLARKVHMEALAEAADLEPRNADLMFLLGVFLYFDDQPAEAAQFFRIAERLGRQGDIYLTSFLGE